MKKINKKGCANPILPTVLIPMIVGILVVLLMYAMLPSESSSDKSKVTKHSIEKMLNKTKLKAPPKYSGNLLKILEANGYLKEETYVGMAEDRNNETYNCTYNNTSIFTETLSKYYYKNNITKQLNKEFYEDCIKYKMHNPYFDTGGDENDIEYYKKLNNSAVIYCYSNKDKYTHKTLNKREIVVKLLPDKILTFSAIKFSNYNLSKRQQEDFFYSYITNLQKDIKVLNKIFKDIRTQ